MLSKLIINNIALIERSEVELDKNLNVLTGETGAGKSIIIDSLNFVLGARADKSLIRYGASNARVEGVFSSLTDEVKAKLCELGMEIEEGDDLILSRTLSIEGRSDVRINGRAVNISVLKSIGDLLVDVVSQQENRFLLSDKNHLGLIDGYGKESISKKKSEVKEFFEKYKSVKAELATFGNSEERFQKIDYLGFAIKEIEDSEVYEGEEEELVAERKKLLNAEKIINALNSAYACLDSEGSSCAVYALEQSKKMLTGAAEYEPEADSLIERLESCLTEISDISDTVRSLAESVDLDGNRLNYVEERISKIRSIKRKYGGTVEDVLKFLKESKEEYQRLVGADERVAKLNEELEIVSSKLVKRAKELSALRQKAAEELINAIEKQLTDLGMKNTKFGTVFSGNATTEDLSEMRADGFDKAVFLISPNAGAPLMPLSKIASGGEASRIMLAVKVIVSDLDNIDTVVFDEIDTGISGVTATTVAEKLAMVSKERQVVCITHLAQLAAMSDHHLLIEKHLENGVTVTALYKLNSEEKAKEVARLSGGSDYSELALPHARKMIEFSENFKKSI